MGEYTQETTYRYVGYGAGEYAAIQIPQGRANVFVCICVPLVALFVVIPLVYLAFSSSSYPNGGGTKPMPIDNIGLYFEYIVLPVVVLLAIGVPLYCFFSRPGANFNGCVCIAVPLLVLVPLFYLMFASSSQHGPYYGKGEGGGGHAFGELPPWLMTYLEFIILPAVVILVIGVPMFFCFSGAGGMQMNSCICIAVPFLVIIPILCYFLFASSVYHKPSPY
jgi:hypothetical protein